MSESITDRKKQHLTIAAMDEVQMGQSAGLETVRFEPRALPEIDFEEVSTRCTFLGKTLSQPLMIASMSGGTEESQQLNERLAQAAEQHQIALALGSMRIALEHTAKRSAFKLRHIAPTIPILANLGGAQLRAQQGLANALKCIEIAQADALVIHLNPLQEVLQQGGDTQWRGLAAALRQLVVESPVPIVVKEVGHGIGPTTFRQLLDLGVQYIDLAGSGGTSWAAIETKRANTVHQAAIGEVFHNFGITLTETLTAIASTPSLHSDAQIIASGGLRSGLDVARAIRLGAHIGSAASPFLKAAQVGQQALSDLIEQWHEQLRITCFITASANLAALRQAPLIESP